LLSVNFISSSGYSNSWSSSTSTTTVIDRTWSPNVSVPDWPTKSLPSPACAVRSDVAKSTVITPLGASRLVRDTVIVTLVLVPLPSATE